MFHLEAVTDTPQRKNLNLIIKLTYLPRVIGFCLLFFMFASITRLRGSALFWVMLCLQCFVWPQLTWLHDRLSTDPKRAEMINMSLECFLCGIWINVMSLSLFPTTALAVGIIFNLMQFSGLRGLFTTLPFLFGGFCIAALFNGFTFAPESSLLTSGICISFIVCYSMLISQTSWRYAKTLGKRRKELKKANEDLTRARDQLWGEMQLAKKIQTTLLPERPTMTGFEIATHIQPADEVGGDYYDIINVKGYNWLVIGDVSGHGVPAGLIMMMVQTAIHTVLSGNPELRPDKLLTHVNQVVTENIRKFNEDKYMTITVFACFKDGTVYFSGLHQDIMIYRRSTADVEVMETDGIWLGLMDDIEGWNKEKDLTLGQGDVMLLYTDGITESWKSDSVMNERDAATDMFGPERLGEILKSAGNGTPEEIRSAILASMSEYKTADDVTLLIVKKL